VKSVLTCGHRGKSGRLNNNQVTGQKVKGLDICYSAAYMSQTQEQQHFTISIVAADWHELMVLQHIMQPSIACASETGPTIQLTDRPPPPGATLDPHPIAHTI